MSGAREILAAALNPRAFNPGAWVDTAWAEAERLEEVAEAYAEADALLAPVQGRAWQDGVDYAKAELQRMYERARRPLVDKPRPTSNTSVQPCRDAMDSADGPWGYREYDAHISSISFYSAMDALTVYTGHAGYEDDDDPNPYTPRIGPAEAAPAAIQVAPLYKTPPREEP